jgi:hypothetical protein
VLIVIHQQQQQVGLVKQKVLTVFLLKIIMVFMFCMVVMVIQQVVLRQERNNEVSTCTYSNRHRSSEFVDTEYVVTQHHNKLYLLVINWTYNPNIIMSRIILIVLLI